MPMDYGAAKMAGMPPDLMNTAKEADDMIGAELSALIPPPERPYNPKVINALAAATSKVLNVLGLDITPEEYTAPVAKLGDDEIRFLAMISAAASDYGKPFPVPLSEVRGDSELTAITAHMMQLAKDPKFEAFLSEEPEDEENGEGGVEVKVEVEGDKMGGRGKGKGKGPPPAGEDFFASRMRS